MKTFTSLWARELGVWFHATSTFLMLAVFTAVTGLVFRKVTEESIGQPFDPATLLFGPLYFWLMIIILTSIIAMRLFSDDRRSGMLEMIMTAPVTDWQIVLAKYAAAMTVFLVACLPPAALPFIVATLRQNPVTTDGTEWAPLATGFLALILCGAFFNAFGTLFAALLRGPASTVIAVFTFGCLLFVIDQAAFLTGATDAAGLLQAVSLTPALRDFSRGIIDTRPIIFWISSTWFCLFAAQRAVLWRRTTCGR